MGQEMAEKFAFWNPENKSEIRELLQRQYLSNYKRYHAEIWYSFY